MTETLNRTKFKYPSLNGLRAFSIFLVLIYHLELNHQIIQNAPINEQLIPFLLFFSDGQLGVNVFFVISGFLITSLLLKEEELTQTISLKNFYIRRAIRIFPAFYAYLLVLLILHLAKVIQVSYTSLLTAATYTKYFPLGGYDWYTAHSWSLSIEEHFYLIFPFIFTLGNKIRKQITFFIILSVPIIKIYLYYNPSYYGWINSHTIFQRIDALAIGCLIAFYKESLLTRLNKHFKMLFYFSFLIIFLLGYLARNSEVLNFHLEFFLVPFGSTFGTIANICIGIIMLYSIYGHKGLWFRLLNAKIVDYIGLLSYSIYLWQQLFTKYNVTPYLPLNLMFIIIFSLLSYYFIEKPFLKLKDKLYKIQTERAKKAIQ